jgi:hypothetical protein
VIKKIFDEEVGEQPSGHSRLQTELPIAGNRGSVGNPAETATSEMRCKSLKRLSSFAFSISNSEKIVGISMRDFRIPALTDLLCIIHKLKLQMIFKVIIWMACILLFGAPTARGEIYSQCKERLVSLIEFVGEEVRDAPESESTVELETAFGKELFQILTTESGTVADLLKFSSAKMKRRFRAWADRNHPDIKPAESIKFDLLPAELFHEILTDQARRFHYKSFYKDRKISGLKVKTEVMVNVDKSMHLFGKLYPKGRHRLNLTNFVSPYVEFQSPWDIRGIRGMEFHLRSSLPAAEALKSAANLGKVLNLQVDALHQHHVQKTLEGSDDVPYLWGFYRLNWAIRLNYLSEIAAIVEEGATIQDRRALGPTKEIMEIFGSLKPEALYTAFMHFLGAHPDFKTDAKVAAVAIRGFDFYDSKLAWGLENRRISTPTPSERDLTISNYIQIMMELQLPFWEPNHMIKWSEQFEKNLETRGLGLIRSWYNQNISKLLIYTHPQIRKLFFENEKWFRNITAEHQELKMLIHDWSADPFLYQEKVFLDHIQKKQIQAWQQLLKGEPINQVMKNFLVDSGLYAFYVASLGIPASVFHIQFDTLPKTIRSTLRRFSFASDAHEGTYDLMRQFPHSILDDRLTLFRQWGEAGEFEKLIILDSILAETGEVPSSRFNLVMEFIDRNIFEFKDLVSVKTFLSKIDMPLTSLSGAQSNSVLSMLEKIMTIETFSDREDILEAFIRVFHIPEEAYLSQVE